MSGVDKSLTNSIANEAVQFDSEARELVDSGKLGGEEVRLMVKEVRLMVKEVRLMVKEV